MFSSEAKEYAQELNNEAEKLKHRLYSHNESRGKGRNIYIRDYARISIFTFIQKVARKNAAY